MFHFEGREFLTCHGAFFSVAMSTAYTSVRSHRIGMPVPNVTNLTVIPQPIPTSDPCQAVFVPDTC